MNKESRKKLGGVVTNISRAEDYAQRVLVKYWDKQSLPIIPETLIEAMQQSMDPTDLVLKLEKLPEQISGKIEFDKQNQKYEITVNTSKHPHHQRFTLAHEIGHYVLSHGEKYDTAVTLYRNGDSDPDEVEANAFAAELLMPKAMVYHLIQDEGVITVEGLAKIFWVSETAMFYRLKNLGLV